MCVCVRMFLIEINTICPNVLKFCMNHPCSPVGDMGYKKSEKANLEDQERPK